jgi:chromosome segregation ATPase
MLLSFLGTGVSVLAQRYHDPLNDKEVNELRETAQEPEKRMKLYIGFAKARMEMIQNMRTNPTLMGEDGSEMRNRLEDLATLVDEIDDNLDDYNDKSQDLRKPLKSVIEMDSDFQVKLTELKRTSTPEQLRNYGIALEDVTDSVNESADSARSMLQDQLEKRGNVKEETKKEKERELKEEKKKDKRNDSDEVKPPCSPC